MDLFERIAVGVCRPAQPVPAGYPLPVHSSGIPYWRINTLAICEVEGWMEWQAERRMAEIVPELDRRIGLSRGA